MAQCDISGTLKYIEDIYNQLSEDKSEKDSKKVIKKIFDDINKDRAALQQASSFAGDERININKPFSIVDFEPTPAPSTIKSKVKTRTFGNVVGYFYPKDAPELKKSLAFTRRDDSGNPYIVMQEGITVAEVLDYIKGNLSDSRSSAQKAIVNDYMRFTYGMDLVASIENMDDAAVRQFIIKHELSHITHADHNSYYNNTTQSIAASLDKADPSNKLLSDSAIEIEARANVEALNNDLETLVSGKNVVTTENITFNEDATSTAEGVTADASTGDFDAELDKVLTAKLQELYPEIELSYTENDIEESGNARYQRTPLGSVVSELENKLNLETIGQHLHKLYPEITKQDIHNVISKHGVSKVNAAITALSNQDQASDNVQLPLEYSLVYIDLLEKTTFMKNSIGMTIREHKVDNAQAKLILAKKMADYAIRIFNGESLESAAKEASLAKKVWSYVISAFKAVFKQKDLLSEVNNRRAILLAKRLLEGVSKDSISLLPKKGTKLIDPSYDFTNQPFSAGIVENVMQNANGSAIFTGSEALAMQGKIYRKQGDNGTDLHDLDFAVSSVEDIKNILKGLTENYTVYEAYNFDIPRSLSMTEYAESVVEKIPLLLTLQPLVVKALKFLPHNNIVTQVVIPKGYKIANVKRFNKEGKGRITSYDIVDTNNMVVGTYRADVEATPNSFRTKLIKESTTGVKAVLVDLIEDKNKRKVTKWQSPNGKEVAIADHTTIFAAKNSLSPFIARDKDIADFNSFYNSAFTHTTEYQKTPEGEIKGKADIDAKTVLINTLLRTQDTLPHEYAHHYIAWFRDTKIVQEAIMKWGSEEALVQAIGEQAVKQKGEAYNWWKKFTNWLREVMNLGEADKELLKNALTDAFLTRKDLTKVDSYLAELLDTDMNTVDGNSTPYQGYVIKGTQKTNKGQTNAINTMIGWFNQSKTRSFLLQGRGGTGKTTVINVLLRELGLRPGDVMFAAPTNKAKKVLAEANKGTDYARSPYLTVAQILGIKPVKEDDGSQNFKEDIYAKKPEIPKVLIIDEASMLHSDNYEALIKRAEMFGSRIIFMGDNAQLPPIGDHKAAVKSVVFNNNKDNTAALTELMRQKKESPIVVLTDKLIRVVNRVETAIVDAKDTAEEIKQKLLNVMFDGNTFTSFDTKNNEGVIITDENFDDTLPSFLKDFRNNPKGTKYIGFNNHNHTTTKNKVRMIRKALFGEKADTNEFIPGEPLVLNGPYTIGIDTDDQVLLDNGEEFTVVSSVKTKKRITYKVGNRAITTANPIEVYEITAKDVVTGISYTFDKPVGNTSEVKAFIEKEKANTVAKGAKPGGAYMLLDVLAQDLSHGYIINSHKAQGSTYDNVYLDLGNIAGQHYSSANDIIKSLYVGASRPRKKLVMIDNRGPKGQIINPSKVTDAESKPEMFENIDNAEANDIIDKVNKCKSKG